MSEIKYKICAFMVAVAIATTGCLYRPDTQQGNELTDEMIADISLGMSKDDVADVLGVPLVTDPFNRDRWDYYYFLKEGKTGKITQRSLSIEFTDDKVSDFRRSLSAPDDSPTTQED